jgi:hypothetical protein
MGHYLREGGESVKDPQYQEARKTFQVRTYSGPRGISSCRLTARRLQAMADVFQKMDADRGGTLDKAEVRRALFAGRGPLSPHLQARARAGLTQRRAVALRGFVPARSPSATRASRSSVRLYALRCVHWA